MAIVLLFVDVEKVVLESPEGKRVAAELAVERSKVDVVLDAKENEIAGVRKKLEKDPRAKGEYQLRAGEYDALVKSKQEELARAQDEAFQPILDRVDAVIKNASSEGMVVVDIADHPPLFMVKACDATPAIAAIIAGGKKIKLTAKKECEAKTLFYVNLERVMRSLEESKRATARLDSFQRERQTELDQRSRRVETIGGADVEARRLELADRYAVFRKELEEREAKESAAMRSLAIKKIDQKRSAYPGAIWLEKIPEVESLAPSCDVSRFFAGDDPAQLASSCEAWKVP